MNKQVNDNPTQRLEVVVISDSHLGTYGCKAKELLAYLKSINPKTLILNGDIIDVWQFSTSFFPKSHLKVIRQLVKMMEQGTEVHYLVGNHDETFRRFVGLSIGNFHIHNKLILELNGEKTWIFHGDVFDVVMHRSKWLAKLGAKGYGMLTQINRAANWGLALLGQKRISLSRDIKNAVKGKKRNITSGFEEIVSNLAIKKNYQYAICGHIHWPEKKVISNGLGAMTYLNSGDWVENMTSLEYYNNEWHLYHYHPDDKLTAEDDSNDHLVSDDLLLPNEKVLFNTMFRDVIKS